jgi:hypothetical protein
MIVKLLRYLNHGELTSEYLGFHDVGRQIAVLVSLPSFQYVAECGQMLAELLVPELKFELLSQCEKLM